MDNVNKSILSVFTIVFLGIAALPAMAFDQNFDINNDWEMDRRYDWVIDVKVIDTNYLNYSGSKLNPLTKLLISYRLNPRFGETAGKVITYEELWYQVGTTIGCRRLHDLNIPATYQGSVRIIPSPAALKNSGAISGVIVRLLLDIALKNCMLSAVFIPRDVFYEVENDLSRFNFYSSNNIPATATKSLAIPVYSNPLFANPLTYTDIIYYCN